MGEVRSLQNNNDPEVDFERICIFYSAINIGYLGMAIAVTFLGFFIHQYSSSMLAWIWVAAVYISYIPRIWLSIQFKRKLDKNEITKNNIKPWENYHFYNSFLPFIIFSAAVFMPYEENEYTGVLFTAFIVTLMIANAVLIYSTSMKVTFLFMNITMVALITRCFLMQELQATVLGVFLVVAYLFLMRLIHRQNKILLENIALKIENRHLSLIDPLTKLWNRRHLDLYINKLISISKRNNEPFSIILLDIDHFKEYNDTHGHNAGDALLIKLANIFIECSRDQDLIIRYGGEEFLVVLPNTNINQAEITADRILARVRASIGVTISAGLAVYANQTSFDQLVQDADAALYSAKRDGRDKYIVATAN